MIDIDKQISFWRNSAEEDLAVARDLVHRNRIRHGLFFAHLALEKALKAHVCCVTQDIHPDYTTWFAWPSWQNSIYNPPRWIF